MAQLIQIGNSRGIRIPKPLIESAALDGCELELKVVSEGLLIAPESKNRRGWRAAFEAMHQEGDDAMLMVAEQTTAFDDGDWEW